MSFIEATRQNLATFTSLPYNSGQVSYVDIARVGLMSTVKLRFKGKLTAKHASKTAFTRHELAPYNLADRLQLVLNNGVSVWDTSGWGAYLKNIIDKQEYKMDQAAAGAESVFAFGNAVSAAGAENNLVFSVNLPVSINDKDMIGLLLLQNDATVLTLRVSNAPATALMTDTDVTATVTGTWEIMLEYFSVPANTKDYPVLTKVHQVLENQVPLNNIGQNKIPMPRGNTYMRIIDCIKLNGKLADAVENAKLVYNLNNTPYDISGGMMKVMHRERYGRDLPKGVYVWDFFYQGIANMGNHRDFVNSAAISEFDQILNIAAGSAFGNSDNVCSMIMDQLVDVVPVAG